MAGKKKSTVARVKDAVRDAVSSVAHATEEHIIQPVGKALGLSGDSGTTDGNAAAEPAQKPPAAKRAAAVRMMTQSVAGKKPTGAKGKAQRATESAKRSQKPVAGSGRKGPRRGASKGR
jgi:hypothetical protein